MKRIVIISAVILSVFLMSILFIDRKASMGVKRLMVQHQMLDEWQFIIELEKLVAKREITRVELDISAVQTEVGANEIESVRNITMTQPEVIYAWLGLFSGKKGDNYRTLIVYTFKSEDLTDNELAEFVRIYLSRCPPPQKFQVVSTILRTF